MQYAFTIFASGVSGAILYQTVSGQSSIKQLKAKLGPDGAGVDIKFTKPKNDKDSSVQGTIKVPKHLVFGNLRTELENDLNDVDGQAVGKKISITSWSTATGLNVGDADNFGCIIQNNTSNYMYAQMFQGFESSDNKALAVAWAVSSASIGDGASAANQWSIQYVMVAGQISSTFSASIAPIDCNLGDQADVKMVDGHLSVTKSSTPGTPGQITFNVEPNFPAEEYYVGFGIRDPVTGYAKASGVTQAFSSTSFTFTPYLRYSVNLVSEVTTNLYSLSTVSDFWPIEYKESYRWAVATFDTAGWLPVKYSISRPFGGKAYDADKLSDDVEKVQITTKRQVKQVILQY